MTGYFSIAFIVVAMKVATASIVGWSNSTVYKMSVPNQSASIFANSLAAIESNPAVISGVFVDTIVPTILTSDSEITFTTA